MFVGQRSINFSSSMIVKGKDRKGSRKKQASTTPLPPESHEQMRCDRCARDFQTPVHRAGWGPKNESAGPLRVQTGLKKLTGPTSCLGLLGGQGGSKRAIADGTRLRHSIITTQNHPPQNHHTTRKENDVPAKHRPTASSVLTTAQNPAEPNQPLDTAHLTTWKPPQCATPPRESASPDPSHAKRGGRGAHCYKLDIIRRRVTVTPSRC